MKYIYEIIAETEDFFRIRKLDSDKKVVEEYKVDVAANWCTCDDYYFRKKTKKKYKCKHLQMCGGIRDGEAR